MATHREIGGHGCRIIMWGLIILGALALGVCLPGCTPPKKPEPVEIEIYVDMGECGCCGS